MRPAWPAGTVQKNGATGFFNPQQNLQEVFYIGANQHVYEAYYSNGWIVGDVTGGSNLAAAGPTSITSFWNPQQNLQEVFYVGANQHVYEAYYSNGWIVGDVTGGNSLATLNGGITSFWNPQQNLQEVFYVGANQHIYEAYWSNGWVFQDMTGSNDLAALNDGITSFWNPQQNLQEVFYVGANQHVYEAYWSNGWIFQDITGTNNPGAQSGGMGSFWNPQQNLQEVFYVGANQHINEAYWSNGWIVGDMTGGNNLAMVLYTISGQVTAGGSPLSGVTITSSGTTAAGTGVLQNTTTDANGNYSFAVPVGGNYTVTPSLSGYTFNPGSASFTGLTANQSANFSVASESTAVKGALTPQPPPLSAPAPAPPPVISGSATNCNDISGTWIDSSGSNAYSFSQTGASVTGTITTAESGCGYFSSTIQGNSTGSGTFSFTATAPSVDACGYPISANQANVSVTINSCSQAQASITSSSGGSGFLGSGGGGTSGTTYWSRISNPPGISVSVDLKSGKVNTSLSGQNKTATLTVRLISSASSSTSLASHGGAQAGSSFTDSLQRTQLVSGQYGSVIANWDDIQTTVPVSFYVLGNTRFSQYNNPYETQCSANPQSAWIIYKIDASYCYYKPTTLGSQFLSQTNINGTGVSIAGDILKPYASYTDRTGFNICSPAHDDNQNGSQTFYAVDTGGAPITKITGAHNTVLSDGTGLSNSLLNNNPIAGTLAKNPDDSNLVYGDQIMMIDSNDSPNPDIRSVQDLCPACRGGFGAPNWPGTIMHIDTFNSSQTCSPSSLGDYGNRSAIRLR